MADMAGKKYTNEENLRIIEVINDYPGNYTYAAKILAEELNRSSTAILLHFRSIKWNYDTPFVVSATGKKTPIGVTRWTVNAVPEITLIRRWANIKHLLLK